MKKIVMLAMFCLAILELQAQKKSSKAAPKYDTIIRKHVDKPQPVAKPEIVLPVPEFINQPYYYDRNDNRLVKLESATAQLISKKKTLGLKGAKQFFSMEGPSSKIRFTTKTNISFFIKTSGDVIDLTSYIKLYKFVSDNEKREVTIVAKEGMINDKEEVKGRQIPVSVKMISKDNYMIQFAETLEAGEYGFVWVKNMELKEFTVHAFAIDWKSSD